MVFYGIMEDNTIIKINLNTSFSAKLFLTFCSAGVVVVS